MIGETVGTYVIERRLGEGGMGTVYAARHTVMGRRAAVKVLRAEQAVKPDMVQRFFNEARAAAAIEHPSIVDVYDVGTRADGVAFLVMELLDGEPLSARLRAPGRLPVDTALRIARQIAAGLAAAHACGIVHRDLKPDNVFLVPDTETTGGERAKLLDFGIAKLHGDLAAGAPITQSGAIFGTPVYMAPEQCRGAVEVDHRADLYALGCILYEMLCGRPPFRAAGLGDLLAKHMLEAAVSPRQLRADVPLDVDAAVLRLLEKDPADRFQSATDVVVALGGTASLAVSATIAAPRDAMTQSSLGGSAAELRVPPPPPPRRRHGAWIGLAAGGAAMAAVVALVATQGGAGRPSAVPDAAVVAVVTPDAGLTVPVLGLAFVDDLERASGSGLARYADAGAWESAGHDFALAAAQRGAPVRWSAAVKACAGMAAHLHDDHATAEPLLADAAAADPTWAAPLIGLAAARSALGNKDGALEAAREAQRRAPQWWLAVAAEARADRRLGALDAAVEAYRRALQLAPKEPALLAELALVYHAQHLDGEARRYAELALSVDPDMVPAHLLLAERALEIKDSRTALLHAERVVSISPESASGQLARADALRQLHQDADALAAYRKVLALEDETHQQTVAPKRLAEIRRALAAGRLPGRKAADRSRTPRSRAPRSDRAAPDDMLDL